MVYKWCVVPQCTNTSIKTPHKLFISVPKNPKRRKMWLKLARRDPNSILSHTNVFMCEDHFDMQQDVANYRQYKMGFSQIIRVAEGAMPSKFDCQEIRAGDQKRGSCRKKLANTTMSRKAYIKQLKNDIDQGNRATAGTPVYTQKKGNAMSETTVAITEPLQTQCVKGTSSESIVEKQMCRICFTIDCNMYLMTSFKVLNEAYENLTGIMTADEEQLPRYLCTECADRLMNCARFRRRSLQAHSMLLDIFKDHGRVTVELVCAVMKKHNPFSCESVPDPNDGHCGSDDKKLEDVNVFTDGPCDLTQKDVYENINNIKCEIDDIIEDSDKDEDKSNDVAVNDIQENDLDNQNVLDCLSNLDEGVLESDVAGKNFDVVWLINQEDHGEDVLSDCLPSQEVRQEAERGTNTSQHVNEMRIDNQHPPEAEDGPSTDDTFRCDICQYQTDIDIELLEHLKAHAANKTPFHCDKCDYKTDRRSRLIRHNAKHLDAKAYACHICQKAFKFKGSVVLHMRKHSGEKPYACDMCEETFRLKDQLESHWRVHPGKKSYSRKSRKVSKVKSFSDKPFQCDICKKSFRNKYVLRSHLKLHSGEKYACGICNKEFVLKKYLQRHSLVHTTERNYTCGVCKKSFTTVHQLRTHVYIHSDKRPHSCNICSKTFIQKYMLERHLLTHNKKQYICDICRRRFRRKDHVKKHISNMHSDKKP